MIFLIPEELQKDGQEMEDEFMRFHACANRVDMNAWVIDRFTKVLSENINLVLTNMTYGLSLRFMNCPVQ